MTHRDRAKYSCMHLPQQAEEVNTVTLMYITGRHAASGRCTYISGNLHCMTLHNHMCADRCVQLHPCFTKISFLKCPCGWPKLWRKNNRNFSLWCFSLMFWVDRIIQNISNTRGKDSVVRKTCWYCQLLAEGTCWPVSRAGLFQGGCLLQGACEGEGRPLVVTSVGGIRAIHKIHKKIKKKELAISVGNPTFHIQWFTVQSITTSFPKSDVEILLHRERLRQSC